MKYILTPGITDHALIRWLSRVKGYDMEFLRNKLINDSAGIPISDTALVRWLQRIHDIDMEVIREELWQKTKHACLLGLSSYTTSECTYIFKDKQMITVLDASMPKRIKKSKPKRSPRDFKQFDENFLPNVEDYRSI